MWRKGNPCALLVGMQTRAATMESCVELPKKLKSGTSLCPSDSTSGYMPKEIRNINSKDMHPCVYCSIVYNSQAMETAQETISRGVEKKQWYIYAMKY